MATTLKRDIRYLNRDFSNLRTSLIDFSRTYFPSTYNDFTPASTGMLFIEMAAYVGDILSFYQDNQFQETFIQYARQNENVFGLAYQLGYKPKVTSPSIIDVDVYQQLPAITSGSITFPDYTYALKIGENTIANSTNGTSFILEDPIDFSISSSNDPTEVTVYQISGTQPTFYLLRKTRKAISAAINTTTVTFGSPQKFSTSIINGTNIIGILDVFDSDGNQWYEVDNLAQESVFTSIPNTSTNDPNLSGADDTPTLLKIKQVQRRFTSRFLNESTLQIEFGAGTTGDNDEEFIPNPDNVGLGLPFQKSKLTTAYSPLNFVLTNTYGIAPSNTTLTIRYLTGGGLTSNIDANTLTGINTNLTTFINSNISNTALAQTIFNSVASNNPIAASGGTAGDTLEEIRQNALGNYQNQLRAVTTQDYLIRVLSMPSSYGAVAKAYAQPAKLADAALNEAPTVLDLYVLSYDLNQNLRVASTALKQNIKTYLSQYKMINDSIKIKDAFIINIGIDYDVVVLPNYNNNEVLLRCNNALINQFNIEDWQINQPIIMRDLYVLLDRIEGVQTVKNIKIYNKTGTSLGYSNYSYDVEGALVNGIVYPSVDPMIFEIKYRNTDIKGRVVSF
jgi:hypothetical protein